MQQKREAEKKAKGCELGSPLFQFHYLVGGGGTSFKPPGDGVFLQHSRIEHMCPSLNFMSTLFAFPKFSVFIRLTGMQMGKRQGKGKSSC